MTTYPSTVTPDRTRLRATRTLLDPALRRAVDRISGPVRDVLDYHFGWTDAAGCPAQLGWGKGIRGAVVLAAAQATGGPVRPALPVAVAVELVHNFTLLHDDVLDGDELRRGRPAARTVFGDAQAILAGDALLVLGTELLHDSAPAVAPELYEALRRLVIGQSADLAFEARGDVTLPAALAMAAGKTAALFAGATAAGTRAAGAAPEQVTAARRFGEHLGLAFQLVDDVLGIWGDEAVTRKPVGADLRRNKKSLPVVFALASGTAAGRSLAELYAAPRPFTEAQVARATDLIEEAGGRAWARAEAGRQHAAALGCLADAYGAAGLDSWLFRLAGLAVWRDH
jgi:geranylgeranyl diphosphate synthase type I